MKNGNSSNFHQALWLGIGQACTFAIAFLTAPILARYFDKVEYGTYRQILYVYTSLQALFTMGLPSVFAYFIPRLNMGQQKLLINRLTRLFLLLGAVFSLALFLSADLIADLLRNPELSTGIRIFSPFPLFTLPTMGVEGIYTAIRRTKEIAVYQIFSKSMMLLCIVLPVVIFGTGYKEAVIGWGIANFMTFLAAMYMKNKPYRKIDTEAIPDMYRTVFNYSLPLTGAFIAGFFVNSADQFFVSRYYGTQVFAEFSNGCLSIPIVGMIAVSVKSVLLPLFSKADANHDLDSATQSYGNAVRSTAIIVIPMLIFCMFFAQDIMVALFGRQYQDSESFFRMYIIRDFLQIFPYFAVLMALGYSKLYMHLHVIGAILIWTADFIIVSLAGPAPSIVLISSIFHSSCTVAALIYIYKKTSISLIPSSLARFIMTVIVHCSVCVAILFCARLYLWPTMNVFASIAICGIMFYLIIISTGRLLRIDYVESVKRLIASRYVRK